MTPNFKNCQSWLYILVLFVLVGCGGQSGEEQNIAEAQGQLDPKKVTEQGFATIEQPSFDLSEVKRQYSNTPLTVVDISERNKEGKNAIVVTLAVPLNPSINHQSFFSIANNKGVPVTGQWVLSNSGKQMWFENIEPSHAYIITVEAGLTAANNKPLSANKTESIETRSIQATATFDTDGHYVIQGIKQGLPIQAVNVPEVNIDYFRIDPSNIEYFLGQINYVYRWNIERLTKLGQLVYSGRYDLSAPKNTRVKRQIDISGVDQLQSAGIYFAVMTGAGNYQKLETTWFSITDLGLHTRTYQDRLEAHVKSVTTGEALADIDVSAYVYDESSREQRITKTVKTNVQGIAIFDGLNNNISSIVAQTDSQMSMVRMRKPQLDLSEFEVGQRPQLPVELFVYAPRDLYRPGEKIDFNALIRDGDGQFDNAPVLSAIIRAPDGSVAHQFSWNASELGHYHYNWTISSSAAVGNWALEVTGVFEQAQVYPFKVEEFLPERMKLVFNDGDKTPLTFSYGDKLSVPVLGEYLYGAPAANNRLSTDVLIRPWHSPVKALPKFHFGDVNSHDARSTAQVEDINLDIDGKGNLQVEGNWSKYTPVSAKFISRLFESGGRPVIRNYSALVWPQPQLLGIAPRYKVLPDHDGPKAHSVVKLALVKADIDGKLYGAKDVKVSLIRLDRNYFWVNDSSRGWHYQWTDNQYIEMTKMVDIADGQEAIVDFPVEYGGYIIKAQDSEGKLLTSMRFHAGHNWYRSWQESKDASQSAQPDKITLALDKGAYQGGDIATVNIVAPHSGQAIVMVEGSKGPLWQQLVDVSAQGSEVEIPVDSRWRSHDLYVTAMIIRPADSKQAITPKRSFGLIHLPLDRKPRILDVSIELNEKLLPQQTVTAKVNVSAVQTEQSQPIKVTLAVVDEGVLNISEFTTPNPGKYFYGQRRYGVQSRDMFDQLIDVEQRTGAQLRFGGDADLARGGKKPQTDVQIVSMYYEPKDVVNGVAEFDIELPDFNGQLRLMAVAYSKDKVGSSEHHVTVAAPVVAELSMPRFLAYQDKSTIALDLHNLSAATQKFDLQLAVAGQAKLLSANGVSQAMQSLQLAPNERQVLRYHIESTGINGSAQIITTAKGIRLNGQTSNLMRQWQLGMRPAYPLTVRQTSKTVKKNETWQFDTQLINDLIPHTVNLSMSADNRVKLPLGEQLKNLLAYPYGCLEQTSSRAFVLTYATEQAQKTMAVNPMSDAERVKAITIGIDRLASLQLSNGGYGLWRNSSPEEHWLTVYVADFLVSAKQMGIDVPYELYDKTISRLRVYLRKKQGFSNERYSTNRENYRFSYRAYAGYVLSRLNRASLGQLRHIYDQQWDDSETLIGQFHLGLALYNMGDKKRGIAALNKAINQISEFGRGGQYYGDYGSDLRDWALIVHLMLESKLSDKFALSLGEFVANQVYRKRWFSTQERNALFLAGTSLAKHQGQSWSADLLLAKSVQSINHQGSYRRKLGVDDISQGLSLTSTSDAPLFVDGIISGYTASKPKPVREQLSIERRWYNLKGEQIEPQSFNSGELAIVKLTVNAKQRTPDGLIVDLVPAGFEPENQNLGKGIALNDLKIDNISLDKYIYNDRVKFQEYRDDRFVAAVDLAKDRPLSVVYLLRAVTPGDYLVPPPFVEDMYAPKHRAIGQSVERIRVLAP